MVKRVLGIIVVGLCMVSPAIAVAQERVPNAGSTAVGVDAGAFIPRDGQLDVAPIVNVLLEYLRDAAGQSPHRLRDHQSELLPRIERFAAADPAAGRSQLQLGRREVAPVCRDRRGRVLHPAEGQRRVVRRLRDQGRVQCRRRCRVLHRPNGLVEGRGALPQDQQNGWWPGSVGAGVHRWIEEVTGKSVGEARRGEVHLASLYRR